jgi:hypothetical protein
MKLKITSFLSKFESALQVLKIKKMVPSLNTKGTGRASNRRRCPASLVSNQNYESFECLVFIRVSYLSLRTCCREWNVMTTARFCKLVDEKPPR